MTSPENRTLLTGLAMGESARWRDGRFLCSDWVAGELLSASLAGEWPVVPDVVTRTTWRPFCFDWLADGTMLVTSQRGLERLEGSSLVLHADLTHLSPYGWNEPAVDPRGNCFANNINFDMTQGMQFEVGTHSGLIAVVRPDGSSDVVADDVAFPNGMAVTPDGSTLICSESYTQVLSAWDIQPDGSLANRRVWASLEGGADGVSIDREGGLWCSNRTGAVRVLEGGRITDTVETRLLGFSCALGGGPDGRLLAVVCNEWNGPENIGKGPRIGEVEVVEVDIPAP
jgi:sugar lactone lactonase YvrE